MERPQTIQIFLPDGSPSSIKIAELTNRVIQAILIPKNKLSAAFQRKELSNDSIYFLFGNANEGVKPLVYIGESEKLVPRLQKHQNEKEFWNYALVINSTKGFSKTHIRYLEYHAIEIAKEVNRFKITNDNTPSRPTISESLEADLLDNFDTIKILLSTLGFPLFDKVDKKQTPTKEILYIKSKGIIAEGDWIDDGFVIFKGSQAVLKAVPKCPNYILNLRDRLIEEGILKKVESHFVFTENHVVGYPSNAAMIILGRTANGWTEWKNKAGKTLDELKRK